MKGHLNEIKEGLSNVLGVLGLTQRIPLKEIEEELSKVNTVFQSLLLLGILSRIMQNQDTKLAEIFIPAITNWKNYLPHQDLDGLSPAEYSEKYSRGDNEIHFMAELMSEYQENLERSDFNPEDFPALFAKFQKDFFDRIPAIQPFSQADRLLTIKEIIIEERKIIGHPTKNIDRMGMEIFVDNVPESLGFKIAEIEDFHFNSVNQLVKMQVHPNLRNRNKIKEIRKRFEHDEPYYRSSENIHAYYLNYALVVFLDEDVELALSLLEKSLAYKPDYKIAKEMKKTLSDY